MSILSENIRILRAQKQLSQQKLADELSITRARLSKYEEGKSDPPLDILKQISTYFHISIDILLSVDLRKNSIETLLKLNDNRILLPITVDKQGKDFIEIIPHKAKAGYLAGYNDPEFIEKLQQIHLPFLKKGKYRAFPIEGDSMPPHSDGSFIIGKFIDRISDVKDNKTYIIISKTDGIVYKRVVKQQDCLLLSSDNSVYKQYKVKIGDVIEIWEYACSLSTKEGECDDINVYNMKEMLLSIKKDIAELKNQP